MNFKLIMRGIGGISFLSGLFFVLDFQGTITGNIIGSSSITFEGQVVPGVVLLLFSALVFSMNFHEEFTADFKQGGLRVIPIVELEKMINTEITRLKQIPNKTAIVLDTSAISQYEPVDVEKLLKDYARKGIDVLAPPEVINEIADRRVRTIVKENTKKMSCNREHSQQAKGFLDQTTKKIILNHLESYVVSIESGGKYTPPKIDANKAQIFRKVFLSLVDNAKKHGRIASDSSEKDIYRGALTEARQTFDVDETDQMVVTYASTAAERGKGVVVLSCDNHIEEGLASVLVHNPNLHIYHANPVYKQIRVPVQRNLMRKNRVGPDVL